MDGPTFELVGVRYEGDEPQAVRFALGLYVIQLAASSEMENPDTQPLVQDVVSRILRLDGEIEKGLTTVDTRTHTAIMDIFLPQLAQTHERMPVEHYVTMCSLWGIKPFDLFYNAMTARQMLNTTAHDLEVVS